MGNDNKSWLAQGLISAALSVVLLSIAMHLRSHERDRVRLLERSKLYPLQAALGVIAAMFAGAVLAWILSLIGGPTFGAARGLSFGAALLPVLALSYGYLSVRYDIKTSTDQSLRYSTRVALRSVLLSSLLGVTCFGAIYGSLLTRDEGISNAILGLSLGVVSLMFGGLPVLQHLSLRIVLRRLGLVPRRLVDFIEAATTLNLLRPVGGGHMFRHECLREYFRKLFKWH